MRDKEWREAAKRIRQPTRAEVNVRANAGAHNAAWRPHRARVKTGERRVGKKQSEARTYILGLGEELCVATTGALALRRVVLKRKWSRGEMDGGHKRTMIVQQGTERFGRSGAGPERGGDGPGSRGKREGFVGVGSQMNVFVSCRGTLHLWAPECFARAPCRGRATPHRDEERAALAFRALARTLGTTHHERARAHTAAVPAWHGAPSRPPRPSSAAARCSPRGCPGASARRRAHPSTRRSASPHRGEPAPSRSSSRSSSPARAE